MNRRWLYAFCVGALLMSTALSAFGQGASAADRKAFAKMAEWTATPMGYAENYVVDLRGKLPVPGEQQMQDCTSWALAYAMKSFMESVDQGWSPNAVQRTFSPRFIYNQINEGKDEGSQVFNGLTLLKEKGCATLATCPYVPGDFKGQPTAAAIEEAKLFKIRSFRSALHKDTIRAAVQRGHVVPIGVIVTPRFMSGHWEIYDRKIHDAGMAERRPGQPHGRHAMCIVGFDDTKNAFLVMNSWGTGWGKNGYFWLDYGLADTFNKLDEEVHFMDWAVVVDDERIKVEAGPGGRYVAGKPDLENLAVDVEAEYRGFDAETRAHQFFMHATIAGDPRAVDLVDHVDWSIPVDPKKPDEFSSLDRNEYFGVQGTLPRNEMTITAKVAYKDHSPVRTVQGTYKLPAPTAEDRRLAIGWKDWYEGKINFKGKPTSSWWWETELTGNLADLKDVVKVVWNAGSPDGSHRNVEQTRQAIGAKGKFGYFGSTLVGDPISAEVTFNDGAVKTVRLSPNLQSPADDSIHIRSSYKQLETSSAGVWYGVELDLYSPRNELLQKMERVEWYFGPPFENERRVAFWNTMNFNVSASTQKEFRIRAKVFYTDGSVKELSHWVELGEGGKYTDPRRIEMQATSTYLGTLNDQPNWRVRVRPMGDWDTLDTLKSVKYKVPANLWPGGVLEVPIEKMPDGRLEFSVSKPFDGTADIVFKSGMLTRLPFSMTEMATRQDEIGLAVDISEETLAGIGKVKVWKAWPSGPELKLKRIVRVDYEYLQDGRMRHTTVDPSHKELPEFLSCGGVVTEESPLRAIAWFNDGSQIALFGQLDEEVGQVSGQPDALAVQLRERYFGIEEGKPTWWVRADLIGSPENLAKVRDVKFERASNYEQIPVAEGKHFAELKLTRPDDIYAKIDLIDGTEPLRVGVMTSPLLGRNESSLALKQLKVGLPKPVEKGAMEQTVVLRLVGSESELRAVAKVEYRLPPAFGEKRPEIKARSYGLYDGFAYRFNLREPTLVDAIVTLTDGSTKELSVQTGLPPEPVAWEATTRYFQKTKDGNAQYLVDFQLTGDAAEVRAFNQAFYETESLGLIFRGPARSHAVPALNRQAIALGDFKLDKVELIRPDGTWFDLPGRAVQPKAEAVNVVSIHVEPGTPWPGQKPQEREWILSIRGPEQKLEQIQRVDWVGLGKPKIQIPTLWQRGEGQGAFAVRFTAEQPPKVEATITNIDQSENQVSN